MFIYGNNGHALRASHPVRIDKRDLDASGNPKPGACRFAVGKRVAESAPGEEPGWVEFEIPGVDHLPADGEMAFDHRLSDSELEREFPGYAARVAEAQRVNAIRDAVGMAAHDDEIAASVAGGVLKASDLHDLAEINARLRLRGKPEIA